MRNLALFGSVALLSSLLSGCAGDSETIPLGEFAEGQGQLPVAQASYPSNADWGTDVDKVVPNWSFIGFANSEDPALQGYQMVSLGDFYNPNGYLFADCVESAAADCAEKYPDAVFPEGSPWGAGTPKPRALSVGQSAVWCGPCNQEAKSIFPAKVAKYAPMGGQFIVGLIDGPKPGTAATLTDITKWTQKYNVAYPLVADPNGFLPRLFPPSLPSNAVIRTSDMKIVLVAAGAPLDAASADCKQFPDEPACQYWPTFEATLESAN